MKHRLKRMVREAWARLLFHTGLWRLVDRLTPPRLVILAGHCVDLPSCNADLAPDMRISAARLERILRGLGARCELCTVAEGLERLCTGGARRRGLVALSMDDGYKDNVEALLPLLERVGAPATIYVETRPLDERRLNWTHKFFWLVDRMGAEDFAAEYVERSHDEALNARLRTALEDGERVVYQLKRGLKYDADPRERDGIVDALFLDQGGDERALCDRLYMTWEDVRRLRDAGLEIGGHTVRHDVLSTLVPQDQGFEVAGGRTALQRGLGAAPRSFAYPFGRRWDYDEHTLVAVREAGFESAATTHAGTNRKGCDPLQLKRWMIDDSAALHLLATEACGGFDLLRAVGLDLSE